MNGQRQVESVRALALVLYHVRIGVLAHYSGGKNILTFDPHDKYRGKNYEQIAAYLYEWGSDPLADAQQMARRLLANILLANGDAHIKNWSMIYPNKTDVRLSPAYDIVTTLAYIPRESEVALNMAREKRWSMISMQTFEHWADRVGLPWPAIRVHLLDAIDQARTLWPDLLATLPMAKEHKAILHQHWTSLSPDFRLH
ncbi:type II toxin-antitoxin system HipA family toxin [Serratia proteamaculans]|uniref:type II toxin-antitoxin system HipA family toxin n=1 Tax=Serratia proteamaculans TaxID=28151 RepID=UPI0020C5D70B|nr:HipA domain-containing protein [Serratia proteamaculans]